MKRIDKDQFTTTNAEHGCYGFVVRWYETREDCYYESDNFRTSDLGLALILYREKFLLTSCAQLVGLFVDLSRSDWSMISRVTLVNCTAI